MWTKENAVYTMIDVHGVLTYWGPVTIGSGKFYMFIVDNEDSYTPAEILPGWRRSSSWPLRARNGAIHPSTTAGQN